MVAGRVHQLICAGSWAASVKRTSRALPTSCTSTDTPPTRGPEFSDSVKKGEAQRWSSTSLPSTTQPSPPPGPPAPQVAVERRVGDAQHGRAARRSLGADCPGGTSYGRPRERGGARAVAEGVGVAGAAGGRVSVAQGDYGPVEVRIAVASCWGFEHEPRTRRRAAAFVT